jgi:hypothetical protein
MNALQEFDRQVNTLLQKRYPQNAGLSTDAFLTLLAPLKATLPTIRLTEVDLEQGILPFVIVISSDILTPQTTMPLTEKSSNSGIVKLFPLEPKDFITIPEISIPKKEAYLLVDIDRGKSLLNVRPSEALQTIYNQQRSPLTIEEGIAIVTQFPEFLVKNNCFSLLGSRHPGDQRVPAIWINASKQPNLGWCWNGNPHTWLGSASCKARIA